jgi:hypothetical protein
MNNNNDQKTNRMSLSERILLSVIVGVMAGLGTYYLPVCTIFNGAHLGDLWGPLVGMKLFASGHSAYGQQFFDTGKPFVSYPFTTMLAVYPFTLVPLKLAGPLFFSLSSMIFSYALLHDGQGWRLLVLLSPAYIFSLESTQFAPLLSSAFIFPCLLPLICIKPQLGVALCAAGKWTLRLFLITTIFVAISLLIYPHWPADWLAYGNTASYAGKIPVAQGIGFLLLLSVFKWRDRRSRLLTAMSLIPQRLWYDQLLLFFIPETRYQLYFLLISSWLGLVLCMTGGWFIMDVDQNPSSWIIAVIFIYIPSLMIVFTKEIEFFLRKLKVFADVRK